MSENRRSQVNLVSNQQVLAIVTAWNHRLAARFVLTVFFAGNSWKDLKATGADIGSSEPPYEIAAAMPWKAQHPQASSAEEMATRLFNTQ